MLWWLVKPTFRNSGWKACFYFPFEPHWQEFRIPELEWPRTAWIQVQTLVSSCRDLGQVTCLIQVFFSIKWLRSEYLCHTVGLGMRWTNTQKHVIELLARVHMMCYLPMVTRDRTKHYVRSHSTAPSGLVLRWRGTNPYILLQTKWGLLQGTKEVKGDLPPSNFRPELSVFCLVPYSFLLPSAYCIYVLASLPNEETDVTYDMKHKYASNCTKAGTRCEERAARLCWIAVSWQIQCDFAKKLCCSKDNRLPSFHFLLLECSQSSTV